MSFADALLGFAQAGYKLHEHLSVGLSTNLVLALEDDAYSKSYASAGLSIYAPITSGWAAEASFDPTLWAKNGSKGLSASIGLSLKID